MHYNNIFEIHELFFIQTATGGALAAGTLLGWTSPTEVPVLDSIKLIDGVNVTFPGEYGFHVTAEEWSWVGSSVNLGAAAMCVMIGTIINLIGRKLTMLLLVLPFVAGWALLTWADSVAMMLVGRVLLGIAGGAFCVTAPTYTAEIADKEIRGTLGTFFQLLLTVGILFVYAVGSGVSVFVLNIICMCVPIVFGCIFIFMPETPLYLVSKNRNDDAIKSLKWLRGSAYDYSTELSELQSEHNERQNSQGSLMEALLRKASLKAIGISLGLMFFQQLSGINAVIFYTGFIFDAADTGIDGSIAAIIVGVMQVIATFVASMVIDKLGRRIMLLISIAIMSLCSILLGIFFFLSQRNPADVANLGWLPIVSLSIFIVMFSIGFGPIPWVMIGELFAPDVKGVAASLAGATNWILSFVITKTFVNIRDTIGIGETFWLFAGMSALGTIFVFFFVPETKGKSLTEIQTMLAGEKAINTDENPRTIEAKM